MVIETWNVVSQPSQTCRIQLPQSCGTHERKPGVSASLLHHTFPQPAAMCAAQPAEGHAQHVAAVRKKEGLGLEGRNEPGTGSAGVVGRDVERAGDDVGRMKLGAGLAKPDVNGERKL